MAVQGGMKCIKYMMFFFNFAFVILGIVLITIGAMAKASYDKYYQHIIDTSEINIPANIFIVVGSVMFIIAFLGCFGAVRESHCMIMTYSVLVALLLVLEIVAGVLAHTLSDEVEQLLQDGMKKGLPVYRNTSAPDHIDIKESIDFLQSRLDCCGIENYTDWRPGFELFDNQTLIPTSCCIIGDKPGCSNEITLKNYEKEEDVKKIIYTEGCLHKAIKDIAIGRLGLVAIIIAVVELIGVVCACCMAKSIRSQYESV